MEGFQCSKLQCFNRIGFLFHDGGGLFQRVSLSKTQSQNLLLIFGQFNESHVKGIQIIVLFNLLGRPRFFRLKRIRNLKTRIPVFSPDMIHDQMAGCTDQPAT